MRRPISIRGCAVSVRPSVRRSVTPSLRRLLGASYAEYSALFFHTAGPWGITPDTTSLENPYEATALTSNDRSNGDAAHYLEILKVPTCVNRENQRLHPSDTSRLHSNCTQNDIVPSSSRESEDTKETAGAASLHNG